MLYALLTEALAPTSGLLTLARIVLVLVCSNDPLGNRTRVILPNGSLRAALSLLVMSLHLVHEYEILDIYESYLLLYSYKIFCLTHIFCNFHME